MIIVLHLLTSKSQAMKTNTQPLSGRLIRVCSFLLLTAFFVQCAGPEGPIGPPGPHGNDGTAFAYSAIYDITPDKWDGNEDGYWVFLNVAEITEDIYYEGAVLVYRLIEVDPISFNMLPYSYVDNALTIYMDFDAYLGGIDILYKRVIDGVNDTFAPDMLMSFKIVIVEGIPLATLKNMVNINDYNAVAKVLKVQDGGSKQVIY